MRRGRALVTVACVLAAPLLAACSGSGGSSPEPTAPPTPIAKLDVGTVRVARATFCDRVSDSAVSSALGGMAEDDETWGNGDPVPGSDSGDVGHELGCAWIGAAGAAARAWVFARPVTTDLAGSLVAQAGRQQGCTAEQASVFGSPALLQTCTQPDGVERVRRAGLFGDTWLTCEVAGPAATHPREHLDTWCAAVVAAVRTS